MDELDFEQLYKTFGQKVKARRKALHISQSALGVEPISKKPRFNASNVDIM